MNQTVNSAIVPISDFDLLVSNALMTVSESSARIYHNTYRQWQSWATLNDLSPFAFSGRNVREFLLQDKTTQTTRQRKLSAMRQLALVMATSFPTNEWMAIHGSLTMLKTPKVGTSDTERTQRALAPQEVNTILKVWQGKTALHTRNAALIAVMFAAGIRRDELRQLRWEDLNVEDGVLHIRHGKRNKSRHTALFGEFALHALHLWAEWLQDGRVFMFCPLDKWGNVGKDASIGNDNIYRIVQQTGKLAGIAFNPHDARRTLATELLNVGLSPAEVQAQLGHSNPSTTLRYARPVAAAQRRQQVKVRFGE